MSVSAAPASESLGECPSRHRHDRGLKQSEVADALGVTVKTVGRWERDESPPHPSARLPLARLLVIREQRGLLQLGVNQEERLALIEGVLGPPATGLNTSAPSKEEVLRALLGGLNKGLVRGDNYVEVARNLARETGIDWT